MLNWQPKSALGKNTPAGSVANPLVLVIRAELVKKYRNFVIYAHRAKKSTDGKRRPDPAADAMKKPLFVAEMDPDFLFAGFDLTPKQARGQGSGKDKDGWYFVLAERPGEMHFGLDVGAQQGAGSWNELNWNELPANVELIDLETDIPANPARKNAAGNMLYWGKGKNAVAGNPSSGNGDSAQMAAILQQRPVRIYFHAGTLLAG
jgi:hypothetical protein